MFTKLASLFAKKPSKSPLDVQARAKQALERAWDFLRSAPSDRHHLAMIYVAMTGEMYKQARSVADGYYSTYFDERNPRIIPSDLTAIEGVEREIELISHITSHPEFPNSVYGRYEWVNDAFRDQFGAEHELAVQEMFERAVELSTEASIAIAPSLAAAKFRDRTVP